MITKTRGVSTVKTIIVMLAFVALLVVSCGKDEQSKKQEVALTQQEPEKTGAMLVNEAKQKLVEAKAKLKEEGKYRCCINEPCNMCVLDEGECDCYEELKKGEPVCSECYGGWQSGKGIDKMIKKEDVKTSILMPEHNDDQSTSDAKDSEKEKEYYTCTMHPSVKSTTPGNCPVCGMTLIKKML